MIGGQELSEALVRQTTKLAVTPADTATASLLAEAGFDPDEAMEVASRYGLSEEKTLSMAAALARGFVVGLATGMSLCREETSR